MAEPAGTTISPAEPIPEAKGEVSPEVKSKSRRKSHLKQSSRQDVDQGASTKPQVANPLATITATTTTSTAYEKDPVFLMMASGQIESAEVSFSFYLDVHS